MRIKEKLNKLSEKIWQTIPVAIYQTRIEDGMFVMINPYGAKMLGFNKPEDVIGKVKSSDLYCCKRRDNLIKELLKFSVITDFEICLNINNKETWVCATAKLLEEDGIIEGSLTDISERKKIEIELDNIQEKEAKALGELQIQINKRLSEYELSERKTA